MSQTKIFIGCDHGGFELKEALKSHLSGKGYEVRDFGTYSKDSVDFPDFAFLVAQAVSGDQAAGGKAMGIVIDTIGQASAIVCNKVPGIRAVVGYNEYAIQSSREHSNANVLCLGGGLHGQGLAKQLVDSWLGTDFAGGRHQARLDKITAIEQRVCKA
jgi:ribose 5-phosphate isomerase B